ncbi:hypothetical protein [Limosilactobacillus fermentum]
MTTIDGVITNDMDFKHLDTTKNIVITSVVAFLVLIVIGGTAHTVIHGPVW